MGTVVAACVALVLPAAASATTYCVNEPACVAGGGKNEGKGPAALQEALKEAAAHPNSGGPDVVVIGPDEYSRKGGFKYSGEPVAIEGAGRGATILTDGGVKETAVLTITTTAGPLPSLADVTIQVPKAERQTGLVLEGGSVERVAIQGGGGESVGLTTGLDLVAGVFASGSIEMMEAGANQAVEAHGGELRSSKLTGGYGVQAAGAVALRGCRISANVPVDFYNANITIEDSLLDLRGGGGPGITEGAWGGNNAMGTFRGLTLVNGSGSSQGILAEGYKPEGKASAATVTLEDSIVSHITHPFVETTDEAGTSVAANSDYSSFEPAGDVATPTAGGSPPTLSVLNPVSTTPDFVNPVLGEHGFSEGDWHLAPTSPLIDAGTPGTLQPGEFEFDAEGNPRIVNGRRDVGAYEYQRRAPIVTASASATTATTGQAITFSGSATEPEPGDKVAGYQWTFDDGASVPAGASATHAFSTLGTHTATLTATDALGIAGTAKVSVSVTVHVTFPGLKLFSLLRRGGSAGARSSSLPSLSALQIAPKAFRAARSGASITRKAHVGGRVGFKLSKAATVEFGVERLLPGFMHGHKCLAGRHGSKAKRCTRRVKVRGSFPIEAPVGADSFRFAGRIGGHTLAPGGYLLLASVAGSPAKPLTASFRIAR